MDDNAEFGSNEQSCLKKLRSRITVEPVIFLFMFSVGIHGPAVNALTYAKVCHTSVNDNFICQNMKNGTLGAEEDQVQSGSSHQFLYQNLCFEIPAILLSFLYGSVSDNFSTRLALALPLVGQSLSIIIYVMNVHYMKSSATFLLIGFLISGFFGGWITFLLAAFSYLSEVTALQSRTSRIAVAEGIISISIAMSFLISGVALDKTNYNTVFVLSLVLYVTGIIYIFAWLQEPKRPSLPEGSTAVKDRFNMARVKEAFTCLFKQRRQQGRTRLIILMIVVLTMGLSYNVMYTLGYLYLKRRPLSWSQTIFGIYIGYFKGLTGLSLLIVIPLFKKCGLSDTVVIIISILSSSLSELLFGLSTKTWLIFLVPVVGAIGDAKMTCVRAICSTLVEADELGKMFAAIGSLQSLSGILGTLLFNTLYPKTLSFWPGFSFCVGVMISFIPLSLIGWLHFNMKQPCVSTYTVLNQTEDDSLISCGSGSPHEDNSVLDNVEDLPVVSEKRMDSPATALTPPHGGCEEPGTAIDC